MIDRLPTFSLVIEWENAKLSDTDRATRMLCELQVQLRALRSRFKEIPEIWLLYDQHEIDPVPLQKVVGEAFVDSTLGEIHLLPVIDADYYEQKNIGATRAKGDVVVFLDSDVVPEAGWLEGLLNALVDPSIEVVGGNTTIELDSFISRAFALFWFFPLYQARSGLRSSNHFFANNVAFRRELICDMPFPQLPSLRGACTLLAQRLLAEGHLIYINEGSRVTHPAPNGYSHMFRRAMAEGHDDLLRSQTNQPDHNPTPLLPALRRFRKRVRQAFKRIRRNHAQVGLSSIGAIGAGLVAANYFGFYLLGLAVSSVSPGFVRRHFSI